MKQSPGKKKSFTEVRYNSDITKRCLTRQSLVKNVRIVMIFPFYFSWAFSQIEF